MTKKVRGARTGWERVALPDNLPPVDLSISADNLSYSEDSKSPPPGRPGQVCRVEKRNRSSTDSESGQNLP